MTTRKVMLIVLFVAGTLSCRSMAGPHFDGIVSLVSDGNRVVDGKTVAGAFGARLDCSTRTFDKILVHDDRLGCFSCASFDVKPIGDCHFEVRTIYVTESGDTRDEALEMIEQYVSKVMPSGGTVETVDLPTSSANSTLRSILRRVGEKTYEARVQVSSIGAKWIASAVMTQQ